MSSQASLRLTTAGVPKSRSLFGRLAIPRFCDMEQKAAANGHSHGSGASKVGETHESAAERWRSLVKESLVEVVDQQGKAILIARHILIKSANNSERDYTYALKYIIRLLYKDTSVNKYIDDHPNLRLQAWFEDFGLPSRMGGSYGRYVDIDPDSWSEVWSFADRISVVV